VPLVPEAVERLAAEFGRLPGIGPKTAQRLTFYCLRASADMSQRLAGALNDLHTRVRPCSRCFFIADGPLCAICTDAKRDGSLLCVVEEALDVLAVERSGEFHGLYHVLGGALSPMDGIGPATAYYVAEQLARHAVTVSRPAHGLPAGSDLEYADELTMARAFAGRRAL
jgi:recombination protein RecR